MKPFVGITLRVVLFDALNVNTTLTQKQSELKTRKHTHTGLKYPPDFFVVVIDLHSFFLVGECTSS
jgi:hypothetical protein